MEERYRIFVGGLGESVTREDLQSKFSSFGVVDGVDIIRSNNRSFAYVQLQSISDKSLTKLFSLYNGCLWKGGRLKLEKAKEHYLARLQREWAKDEEEASEMANKPHKEGTPTQTMSQNSVGKRPGSMVDNGGLKIFFPATKKIKLLPVKGTGKHKYSFQRFESLPLSKLNVCDCEEHSKQLEREGAFTDLSSKSVDEGVCEKEIRNMKVVMERLFRNEDEIQHESEGGENAHKIISFTNRSNQNAVADMKKLKILDDIKGLDATTKPCEMALESRSKSPEALNKRHREETRIVVDDSNLRLKDGKAGDSLKMGMSHDVCPNKDVEMGESHAEPQKRVSGMTWLQKNSWKKLVGETGRASFSLTNVLATQPPNKLVLEKVAVSANSEVDGKFPGQNKTNKDDYERSLHSKVAEAHDSKVTEQHSNQPNTVGITDMHLNPFVMNKQGEKDKFDQPNCEDGNRIVRPINSSHSWVQKASWKQLTAESEGCKASFSLSNTINASSNFSNAIPPKNDTPAEPLHQSSKKCVDATTQGQSETASRDKSKSSVIMKSASSSSKRQVDASGPLSQQKPVIDGTLSTDTQLPRQESQSFDPCIFMRSENAEGEWLKTKAFALGSKKAQRKSAFKRTS